ncbi:MAG: hypothetical protein JW795_06340 [Chitinivibrionales bacterium]|nr:hypothetical protein [Chitinivibrionales bacterium]
MIKKSVITFAIITTVYAFVMQLWQPQWNTAQNQWQENVIIAQHFLYEKYKTVDVVIIGSSLAARITADSLPKTCFNFSLGGQSIHDGLKVIAECPQKPKLVLIEMNMILRGCDKRFTGELFTPVIGNLKRRCNFLRNSNQPIAILLGKIKSSRSGSSAQKFETTVDSVLFNKLISSKIKEYSDLPDSKLIESQFKLLRQTVDRIESYGTAIAFFEMPVDSQLTYCRLPLVIRENFNHYFPHKRYTYLMPPSGFPLATTDGQHLDNPSARRYSSYFVSMIGSFNSNLSSR